MDELKVIIAGSRGFNNYNILESYCDVVLKDLRMKYNIVVISGGAKGADKLGEKYAWNRGYRVEKYLPNWNLYHKSAGMVRNTQMARASQVLIAFWDGASHGTRNMIEQAKSWNLAVYIYNTITNQFT